MSIRDVLSAVASPLNTKLYQKPYDQSSNLTSSFKNDNNRAVRVKMNQHIIKLFPHENKSILTIAYTLRRDSSQYPSDKERIKHTTFIINRTNISASISVSPGPFSPQQYSIFLVWLVSNN